ncbi:alpha/beta fold hydrolase [Candidatus Woesebacteria bacterium]|nr:alpha/beta fold hydrolase [Candidatus Woesebacteria bacterium]
MANIEKAAQPRSLERRKFIEAHGDAVAATEIPVTAQELYMQFPDRVPSGAEVLNAYDFSLTFFGLNPEEAKSLSLAEIDKKYSVIFLASGLISNPDQWNNSTHSLVKKLLNHQNDAKDDGKKTVCLAVSCPGFGGTALRDTENATKEDVSTQRYSEILQVLDDAFQPECVIGHSAGGEAVLRFAQDNPDVPVVALQPSISELSQNIFRLIGYIERLKELTHFFPLLIPIANRVNIAIVNFLTGKDLSPQVLQANEQTRVHLHEAITNTVGYHLKLQELADRGDVKHNLPLNCRIVSGDKDTLTTRDHIKTSIRKIIETSFRSFADNWQLASLDEETEQELIDFLSQEEEWGHDTVFLESEAQVILLEVVDTVISRKRIEKEQEKNTTLLRVRDAIQYLQSIGVPIEVNITKSSEAQKTESSFSERDWEDLLKRLNEVIKVKVWEIVATYISAIDPEKTNYQEARDFILEKFVSIPFVKDTLEANKHEIYETDDRTYDRFYFVVNLFYQETYGIDLKPRLDTEMDSRSKAYNLLREMLGALHHQKKREIDRESFEWW